MKYKLSLACIKYYRCNLQFIDYLPGTRKDRICGIPGLDHRLIPLCVDGSTESSGIDTFIGETDVKSAVQFLAYYDLVNQPAQSFVQQPVIVISASVDAFVVAS